MDDDASWEAIEAYRQRLTFGVQWGDNQAILGASKDLVEAVARVVILIGGGTVGDEAKFPKTVDTAQVLLGARPSELAGRPEARTIAQSAVNMVKAVNEMRNGHGAGHGRARVPNLADADIYAVADASMLWVRWALRLLEPILNTNVSTFIEALRGPISFYDLRRRLADVNLSDQLPPAQHSIGVTFGQRAAGGFINAFRAGIEPLLETDDLVTWPTAYRLGLVEGIIFDWVGQIGLSEHTAQAVDKIIEPVPAHSAVDAIAEITGKIREAGWTPAIRENRADQERLIGAIQEGMADLPPNVQRSISELCDVLTDKLASEEGD